MPEIQGIFTDGLHLVRVNLPEHQLTRFAQQIGIDTSATKMEREPFAPHYNLTTTHLVRAAVLAGAQVVTYAMVVRLARAGLISDDWPGFDTSSLQAQVQNPPMAKDWEIGEAFAEVMLEDKFDASFPWRPSWDKRTPRASLPGPDMPGFHRKERPRFLFGEVKSSSEAKSPPQVAHSGDDCLCQQVKRLMLSPSHRQQLIEWLLVRTKESAGWQPIFDEALKQYATGDACICGVLVRGGLPPNPDDMSGVQDELSAVSCAYDIILHVFYLPFHKSRWIELVYGTETTN